MKKVAFYTLGCKVNQYETEAMSDRKSRQIIRRAKKQNENAYIIVTGCYAQTARDEVAKIEGVNLVLGAKERDKIVELTKAHFESPFFSDSSDISRTHTFEPLEIGEFKSRTRAYIKVQEGCNQFCSYCIIPYARGPIRSRDLDDVIEETERLAMAGFTEVTYVGIHIASYGLDKKNYGLADLLCLADKVDGIKRIRLSSIEPMTLNREFIEKVSGVKKLCHHFHLSLQSGADETLKRMNRRYTTSEYFEIVSGLRSAFPDVAITTDIMVGFPGETDEEFAETCAFLEKVAFSGAHIFQYSRRKGTPADSFENQISSETKAKRSKIVKEITDRTQDKFMRRFLETEMEVLFEQRQGAYFEGKTNNYMNVLVKTADDLSGIYKTVRLEQIKNGSFIGTIAD